VGCVVIQVWHQVAVGQGGVLLTSCGELAVQYSDGTLLSPYSMDQLQAAALEGHSYFKLVQQADVPDDVTRNGCQVCCGGLA